MEAYLTSQISYFFATMRGKNTISSFFFFILTNFSVSSLLFWEDSVCVNPTTPPRTQFNKAEATFKHRKNFRLYVPCVFTTFTRMLTASLNQDEFTVRLSVLGNPCVLFKWPGRFSHSWKRLSTWSEKKIISGAKPLEEMSSFHTSKYQNN